MTAELITLGISHKTAPVQLRERLAFTQAAVTDFLREVAAHPEVHEAVVISTCNRTELSLVVGDPVAAESEVLGMLAQRAHVRPTELAERIYSPRNCDAARQLFRVTAGLESMIVGEAEIQGQVKRAYEVALASGTTGPLTNRLFTAALQTGKRVRSETSIGSGRASMSSVAVELAHAIMGNRPDPRVVIIGAGETSELTARAFAEHGVCTIFVANRHADRARSLADRFGGEVVALDDLPAQLGARRRRRRLDGVAASDRRPGGARARHARAPGPPAAAHRPRRAARHRPGLRRPRRRDALRHGRPAGARGAHDLRPRGRGAARRVDRRGGDQALRRLAGDAGRAADDPRAARVRRRDRRAGAGREQDALGGRLRARHRARRGDRPLGDEPPAARADAAPAHDERGPLARAPADHARAVRPRGRAGGRRADRRRRWTPVPPPATTCARCRAAPRSSRPTRAGRDARQARWRWRRRGRSPRCSAPTSSWSR